MGNYELVPMRYIRGQPVIDGYIRRMHAEGRQPFYIVDGDSEMLKTTTKSLIQIVSHCIFRRDDRPEGYSNQPMQHLVLRFPNEQGEQWYLRSTVIQHLG